MKGDFSRGHSPDRKRGETYRRVLHQQGRVLLDADVNALVDAQDHLHRLETAGLGCASGSPNYGYLITSGRLYALFEHIEHVDRSAVDIEAVHRDYEQKYLDRYPSLRFVGVGTYTVTIALLTPMPVGDGSLAIHVAGGVSGGGHVAITATGRAVPGSVTVATGDGPWRRVVTDLGVGTEATTLLTVTVTIAAASGEVWIALVESDEDISTDPASAPWFWGAAGWYGIDGLIAELGAPAGYPALSHPAGAGAPLVDLAGQITSGALTDTTPVMVWLENWERLVTQVEALGLVEHALGGTLDTSVRTVPLGQVKVLVLPTVLDADPLVAGKIARGAFDHVVASDAQLTFTINPGTADSNPCALPSADGYSGTDNRLYRFEVHGGGAIGTATLKWSRDNGTPLAAVAIDDSKLVIATSTGVEDGDLVELLSDDVDLGDASNAALVVVDGVLSFRPSTRRVGPLVQLKYLDDDASGTPRYALCDLTTGMEVALGVAWTWADNPTRVRKWHGVLTTPADGSAVAIENGVGITVTGADLRPGEWWAYEARVGTANLDAPSPAAPHGPERLYAPLAMLDLVPDGGSGHFEVTAWLDTRYSPICELDADDIAFDGDKYGEDANTVQEIIDVLLERDEGGGCCDLEVEPVGDGADDAAAISIRIANELPNGGVVCLHRGHYRFATTLTIQKGVPISLRGCPGALIEVVAPVHAFVIDDGAQLSLTDVVVYAGKAAAIMSIVRYGSAEGTQLHVKRCALLLAGDGKNGTVINGGITSLPLPPWPGYSGAMDLEGGIEPMSGPEIVILGSFCAGDWILTAESPVGHVHIARSALYGTAGCVGAYRTNRVTLLWTSFITGLDVDWVPALDVVGLLNDPEGTIAAPSMLGLVPDTCALELVTVGGGTIDHCSISADYGIYWDQAMNLELIGNRYQTRTVAVRAHHSLRVRLDGEMVECQGDSELQQETAWGLHFRHSGRDIQVSSCMIRAAFGVVFAYENKALNNDSAVDQHQFRAVSVNNNQLDVDWMGILLAPSKGAGKPAILTDIAFDHNLIERRSEAGTDDLSYGIVAIADGDETDDATLQIHGNQIWNAPIGIQVSGWRNGVVAENRIELLPLLSQGADGGSTQRARGIVGKSCPRLDIHENTVLVTEVRDFPGEDGSAGIYTSRCALLSIAGNEVDSSGALESIRVDGEGTERVVIRGNRVQGGNVAIDSAAAVTLDTNDFAQLVEVSSVLDVVVRSNRFSGGAEALWVREPATPAEDTAMSVQIVGNRAEGAIRARPARFGYFVGRGAVAAGEAAWRYKAEIAVTRAVEEKAAARRIANSETAMEGTAMEETALVVTKESTTVVVDGVMAEYLNAVYLAYQPEINIIAAPRYVEYGWNAQVNDNQASTIQVGWAPPGGGYATTADDWATTATRNTVSRVVIVGNLVTGDLVVNGYTTRGIVLGNGYTTRYGTAFSASTPATTNVLNLDW